MSESRTPLRFRPPTAERLDGDEPLRRGQQVLDLKALEFWRWAFSDLRQNAVRGHLAEFIVAAALDLKLQVRSSWDDYDLALPAGDVAASEVRLQVKSSAYLQAWAQKDLSKISFGGLRKRKFPFTPDGWALSDLKAPKADVFVFALETARSHDEYDPMDVDQWAFWVLPAHRIDQDSIALSVLGARTARLSFGDLRVAIKTAAREQTQKVAGAKAALTKALSKGDDEGIARWTAKLAELEA